MIKNKIVECMIGSEKKKMKINVKEIPTFFIKTLSLTWLIWCLF